jgi:hypothetical protein
MEADGMSAFSVDARVMFRVQIRAGKDVDESGTGTGNPSSPPTKVMVVQDAGIEAEPQRPWWRLIWPFISISGAELLRWFLRNRGLG